MPSIPTCAWCGRIRHDDYVLRDRDAIVCGHYCSRDCAFTDACGPRFRPLSKPKPGHALRGFSIRKTR